MTARPGQEGRSPDGVLVIDKPAGPTSHDVVARVRRVLGTRRIGHTGTLDPFATGVLPLVVGRATRLAQFFSGSRKAYRAEVRLGVATDTYDLAGAPLDATGPTRLPTAREIEAAIGRFRGAFDQAPPPFSAKKVQGVPAYALARRRKPVRLAPVPVEVFRLEIERVAGDRLVLLLECSAGFYVRALAHDLGTALGCGAHLAALRRTRSGEFDEPSAVPLAAVEEASDAAGLVVPLPRLLRWLPGACLGEAGAVRVAHGNAITAGEVESWEAPVGAHPTGPPGEAAAAGPGGDRLVRFLGPDGALLAVGGRDRERPDVLQPHVVLV